GTRERAHQLRAVVGMDCLPRFRIDAPQQAMERTGAPVFARVQSLAHPAIQGGRRKKAVEQRSKIESGSAGYDGELNPCQQWPCARSVFAGGESLVGIYDIEHVMGDAAPFRRRSLGGTDIEIAIDLE